MLRCSVPGSRHSPMVGGLVVAAPAAAPAPSVTPRPCGEPADAVCSVGRSAAGPRSVEPSGAGGRRAGDPPGDPNQETAPSSSLAPVRGTGCASVGVPSLRLSHQNRAPVPAAGALDSGRSWSNHTGRALTGGGAAAASAGVEAVEGGTEACPAGVPAPAEAAPPERRASGRGASARRGSDRRPSGRAGSARSGSGRAGAEWAAPERLGSERLGSERLGSERAEPGRGAPLGWPVIGS
ncbi:exported hypothetical protein [Frankia sp. AgKG'84/4]